MGKDFFLENIGGLWFGFAPKLRAQGVKHAFTTRLHGQSALMPGSLNLSLHVEDSEGLVLGNRQRALNALGTDFGRLTTARQVHGDRMLRVTPELVGRGRGSFSDALGDTDGLVTNLPGVPLMLLFADCVPIIVADPAKRALAVAHAGWRGTLAAIAQKAVRRLGEEFSSAPQDCWAVVGPSIGPCCYQVGQEVRGAADGGQQEFFRPTGEKQWKMDLWQANKAQLMAAGLPEGNIAVAGVCTQCNRELFFSHRAEAGRAGRFAALAWL